MTPWADRLTADGWDPATVARAARHFERERLFAEMVRWILGPPDAPVDEEDEPPAPDLRRCMMCRGPVLSTGPHHRMCDRCRDISVSPYAPAVSPDVGDFMEHAPAGTWGMTAQ